MGNERWEHFPHGADVGVRGIGTTEDEAFEQAGMALMAAIFDPESVESTETVTVSLAGDDDELLFVDWLNALIYEVSVHGRIFGAFDVRIGNGRLEATAHGEPIDPDRHRPTVEAKGATYTNLSVRQKEDGTWVAQCVVDV